MGLINRRNALLGWTVWQLWKNVAKHKMRAARGGYTPKGKKSVIAGLATLGGVLWLLRRRRAGSDEI